MLSLEELTRYLRGNRAQMSAFHRGQRVVVGDKTGVVENIVPDDEVKVRLVVRYDDGSVGEPYTTHVRAEEEARVSTSSGTTGRVWKTAPSASSSACPPTTGCSSGPTAWTVTSRCPPRR